MIIGVDVDCCCNNLCEAVLSVYNERHGTNYTEADIHTYKIENNIPCEPDEIKNMFLEKDVWKRVCVVPDAVKYIKMLHDEGHKIYFVSATLLDNVPKKASWLRRNFPFLDIEECFLPVKNKNLVKCDILIDDCLDNLHCYDRINIVYDKPWNQECFRARAYCWEDVYKLIKSYT